MPWGMSHDIQGSHDPWAQHREVSLESRTMRVNTTAGALPGSSEHARERGTLRRQEASGVQNALLALGAEGRPCPGMMKDSSSE